MDQISSVDILFNEISDKILDIMGSVEDIEDSGTKSKIIDACLYVKSFVEGKVFPKVKMSDVMALNDYFNDYIKSWNLVEHKEKCKYLGLMFFEIFNIVSGVVPVVNIVGLEHSIWYLCTLCNAFQSDYDRFKVLGPLLLNYEKI